jgi:nucleoside-diphosphate-sugar epimerase
MKILVTGATGFLGEHLAQRLKQRGHAVRVFARPSVRAEQLGGNGYEVAIGDIQDAAAVARAVVGCEAVVHFAALYRLEGLPLAEFHRINVGGTRNMIEACASSGISRLVHVSTVGVYGKLKHIPAMETHPYGPSDHYQRTKLEAELLVQEAMARQLLGRVVIVRPTGVYGPGDRRFLKLFRSIVRNRFVYPGAAKALYHPTYLEDCLDGIELALTRREAIGRIFHVAGLRYLPMREYIGIIARVLGVPKPRLHLPLWPLKLAAHACEHACRLIRVEPPLYPRRLGFFYFDRAFSIDRARRELGYSPKVDVEEGVRRTAEWYRNQGWL